MSFATQTGKDQLVAKHDDDVVICAALRSPITKAKKGGLAQAAPEEMLGVVLKAIIQKTKIDPKLIEDVSIGNVLPPGGGATSARQAVLWAGIPNTAAVNTVNRQCSSGLASINQIANEILSRQIDIGIAGGVESMTLNYGAGVMPTKMSDSVLENEEAADCLMPMGITSENVARNFNVTREKQDAFAAESQRRAAEAQKAGKFKEEIVTINYVDDDGKERVVSEDDGIRAGVTKESLGKLKPAFAADGTTHAGNASQVSDGAAAVLLARRSIAKKYNLPILGKYSGAAVVGVPPNVMGIGPAFAIPKLLEKAGLKSNDIDIYEINEAFASQALYSVEKVGLDLAKVNPNGGAIALGHPLGATGSRQIATALAEAKRSHAKFIVTSMCIGTGMGMAALVVNEQ
ncbi:acetyl-CoA C-acyltransferase [Malassezia vespertilionis]|uniref:Pot1p n=1 Tax=Malassezia vespertilionis TaxID=2020962 RepID=A0A2N1JB75_9BASI|nr:acetyl-CoA C-acyltransferase [Malassezia vespertilionis]PKI83810.1 Pot1p [Malassezia vespertilionis]WFD06956.1 acetyl-CoA C-acyltransferase [Malassezia vespertilionis]